jgi:hypothetical protein
LQFSLEQRNLAVRAVDEAEERTTRYYCIPPFRWQQFPYDLLTRQDHEWEPLPDPVLARVQCLKKISPKPLTSFDFYRIQLNDPSILSAARRENLSGDLYPFLVYILTHEMVHMVRLSAILEPDRDALRTCGPEEERVQRISRQILSNPGFRIFEPILERFCIT